MTINNLSQLKKAFKEGHDFRIVNHFIKSENIGQVRRVTKVQTNGFYSVVADNPEHKVSKANNGLGYWCEFGKAVDWKFENGICTLSDVMSIEILDTKQQEE